MAQTHSHIAEAANDFERTSAKTRQNDAECNQKALVFRCESSTFFVHAAM